LREKIACCTVAAADLCGVAKIMRQQTFMWIFIVWYHKPW